VVAVVLVCLGCGYQVLGRDTAAAPAASALWLAPVEDNAAEPLFGALVGQQLAREAVTRADFSLVREAEAERVLRVQVDRVGESGAAFVVGDITREYLLTGIVSATLARPDGEVLWRGANLRAERGFAAGADVNQTEQNKTGARELLARDLAREVLRRAALVAAGVAP